MSNLIKTYTDMDDNHYALKPYPYNRGEHACVGCAFKFGNSKACRAAPTCTPMDRNYNALITGRHVWVCS